MNSDVPIRPSALTGATRSFHRRLELLALASVLGLGSASAASVTDFGVLKGRNHEQTSAAAPTDPAPDFGAFLFAVPETEDSVAAVIATAPGAFPLPIPLTPDANDPLLLTADVSFSTQAQLDTQFPNGAYSFMVIPTQGGMISGSLTLSGDSYPNIPSMQNYAAGQDVDTTKDFTVQWPASGLSASDFIMVDLHQGGDPILTSPYPWQPGALNGTATSFVIPANKLDPTGSDSVVNITFIKVTAKNTSAIPGATGWSGYYRSTEILLKLKGGGGGDDTTPPELVSSNPSVGALNVPTTTTVSFRFNEAMGTGISIMWSANVNAAAFQYAWSVDLRTLTCTYPPGFPATANITWVLNPPGSVERFKDVAGNELPEGDYGGLFITASGGGGGCQGGVENKKGIFTVGKLLEFDQTAAATIIPGENPSANFISSIRPETGTTITSASVKLPDSTVKPLQGLLGFFFLSEQFPTQGPMDTAYPAGNYQANVQYSGAGAGSLTINLSAAYPPTPAAANFDAAQTVNANADFVLQFNSFTGAGANDIIQILISDDQGQTVFLAPDECANPPRTLANTATSVTIPKGTLADDKTYDAQLSFFKITDYKTSANPAYNAAAMLGKTTKFPIKTGTGGVNSKPVITTSRIAGDGKFEADVTGTSGRTLTLQAGTDYAHWTDVANGVVPGGGNTTLKDPRPLASGLQVYRVESK